jgi:hypothetical protein
MPDHINAMIITFIYILGFTSGINISKWYWNR